HDKINLETHQLGGQFRKPAYLSFVRSELIPNALPLDVAEILHRFAKKPPEIGHARRSNSQDADGWDPPLLGDAGQRPKGGAAEEKAEEVAPPHSIASGEGVAHLSFDRVTPASLAPVFWASNRPCEHDKARCLVFQPRSPRIPPVWQAAGGGVRVEIAEHNSVVRVPRRVFERLLSETPSPSDASKPTTSSAPT